MVNFDEFKGSGFTVVESTLETWQGSRVTCCCFLFYKIRNFLSVAFLVCLVVRGSDFFADFQPAQLCFLLFTDELCGISYRHKRRLHVLKLVNEAGANVLFGTGSRLQYRCIMMELTGVRLLENALFTTVEKLLNRHSKKVVFFFRSCTAHVMARRVLSPSRLSW